MAEAEFYLTPNKRYFLFREIQLRYAGFKFTSKSVRIGNEVYFKKDGNIKLGKRCCIGSFSKFWNYDIIEIGDDFLSAGNLTINTGSHKPETLESYTLPVNIGKRVWIGVNVTILAGITIGDDVIIGAGSIVTKDIPHDSIAVGVPAKVVKSLNRNNIDIFQQFNWIEKD